MKEGSTVPRRGLVSKRDVLPIRYIILSLTKLINNVMQDGKKGRSPKSSMMRLHQSVRRKIGKNPLEVFTVS